MTTVPHSSYVPPMKLTKDDPDVIAHYHKLVTAIPFPVPLEVLAKAKLIGDGPGDATPAFQIRDYFLMLHSLAHFADDLLNKPRAVPPTANPFPVMEEVYPGAAAALFCAIFPLMMPDLFATAAVLPTLCDVAAAYGKSDVECCKHKNKLWGREVARTFSWRLEKVKGLLLEKVAEVAAEAYTRRQGAPN